MSELQKQIILEILQQHQGYVRGYIVKKDPDLPDIKLGLHARRRHIEKVYNDLLQAIEDIPTEEELFNEV